MVKFEFTLKAKKSVLDKIECYEPINIDYLDKLIHSDLLKLSFHNPLASHRWSNEREQLIEYKKLYNEKNKMCTVTYEKVKNLKKSKKEEEYIPFGRVSPLKALGLFSIRREIRQTLCKEYLTDIDIDNAHPSILLQLCQMYEIDSDRLEEYVNNREKRMKEIMDLYKCSREDAKTLFIILLYFGSIDTWIKNKNIIEEVEKPPKFCEKFKKELGEIGAVILDQNKDIVKFVEDRKEENTSYNKIGSVVSYYLQEIENRILETIYQYCIKNKYIVNNVCVLAADGIMIETKRFKPEILKEFSKVVKDKFGFKLNFSVKEMKQDYIQILDKHILSDEQYEIEFLGGYENKIEIDKFSKFQIEILTKYFNEDIEQLGYEKYIKYYHLTKSFKYYNQYHAFFYLPSCIYKIEHTTYDAYSTSGKSFEHLKIRDEKNKYITKFTTLYEETQHKKMYSQFCFEPNKKEKDDRYNLFIGYKYDSSEVDYKIEDIQIYLEHIYYLTNNDKTATEYIINWISHIIQNPDIKTRVCIVLYSDTEQVGKNLMIDIINELFEGYFKKIKDTDGLTDKFNSDFMGKLLCVGDEINARAQDICNELKDIITRDEEIIEFKGKDKIQVKDYKNYIMTTNNENVFKVSNTDRRYLFIECCNVRKEEEYYQKLLKFKKDKSKLKQLYNYFKTKDLSNFTLRNIPMTEYKKHLILNNLPAYFRFIKDDYEMLSNCKDPIGLNDLYKMSVEYAKRNRLQSTYTDRLFSQKMSKIFPEFRKEISKKIHYIFPKDNGKKGDDKLEGEDYIKKLLEERLI